MKDLDFEDLETNEASYEDDYEEEYDVTKSDQEVVLDDTQLTFTSPIVYGFSLSDKRWREYQAVFIGFISDSHTDSQVQRQPCQHF